MSISKFGTSGMKRAFHKQKVNGLDNKLSKSGDTMEGDLDMTNHKIINVDLPTEINSVVNKGYVDVVASDKLDKYGDSMAGELNMEGNRITHLLDPVYIQDAATKRYIDSSLENSTLRMRSEGDEKIAAEKLDMGGLSIKRVGKPINENDAVTKQYVDVISQEISGITAFNSVIVNRLSQYAVFTVDTTSPAVRLNSISAQGFLSLASDHALNLSNTSGNYLLRFSVSGLYKVDMDTPVSLMLLQNKLMSDGGRAIISLNYVRFKQTGERLGSFSFFSIVKPSISDQFLFKIMPNVMEVSKTNFVLSMTLLVELIPLPSSVII